MSQPKTNTILQQPLKKKNTFVASQPENQLSNLASRGMKPIAEAVHFSNNAIPKMPTTTEKATAAVGSQGHDPSTLQKQGTFEDPTSFSSQSFGFSEDRVNFADVNPANCSVVAQSRDKLQKKPRPAKKDTEDDLELIVVNVRPMKTQRVRHASNEKAALSKT